MFGRKEEAPMTIGEKAKTFFAVHWRGVVCLLAPLILIALLAPFPPKPYQWCAYTMALMAVFWLSECIPLEVTSFLPVIIFPLTGVMSASETCKSYMNDTILVFLGSLFLACAIEQSGLFKRLAYFAVRNFGGSHTHLLACIASTTTFMSLWVTNTTATIIMIPIVLNVLKTLEGQGVIKMYETDEKGKSVASDITTCYFCTAAFSATCGGVGTLIGTATNLAFKGLFHTQYQVAPDYLTFLRFMAIGLPLAIVLEFFVFLYMIIVYLGVFRKGSEAAKSTALNKKAIDAVNKAIGEERKKLGKFSFWEQAVTVLFSIAILGFIFRSPGYFTGWADLIYTSFVILDNSYIRDSAMAMCMCVIMFLLPSTLAAFKNFTAKFTEDLPKSRSTSVLDWPRLNASVPFSFMFLLGGGFVLCDGSRISGLNEKIGEVCKALVVIPYQVGILLVIIIVIFLTNFSSNVVVANLMCPLSMQLGGKMGASPLWFCMAAGFAASFGFILPIGTPGNLLVQRTANIPLKKMAIAGVGPTIFAIIITLILVLFYAPVIWHGPHTLLV